VLSGPVDQLSLETRHGGLGSPGGGQFR
jgi:hypothetical protein